MLPKGKSLCREDVTLAILFPPLHSRGEGGGAVSGHHKASAGITSRRVVLGEVLRHPRHPPGAGRCDRDPWELLCSLLERQLEATQTPRGTSSSSAHLPGAAEPSLQRLCVIPALTSGSSPEHRIKPPQDGLLPDHCPTNVSPGQSIWAVSTFSAVVKIISDLLTVNLLFNRGFCSYNHQDSG